MTVRTKNSEIAFIGCPVAKASAPAVLPFLRLNFCGWVDVVNVENANVVDSAPLALPAKRLNQRDLAFPVPLVLVNLVPSLVPKRRAAGIGAESHVALLVAMFAMRGSLPPVREVALLIAELPSPVFQAVRMYLVKLSATFARLGHWLMSHASIVPKEPKYFDIAVKRIDRELDQPRLFPTTPEVQLQAELFSEGD